MEMTVSPAANNQRRVSPWAYKRPRPYTVMQVEVTTRCHLSCPFCPLGTHDNQLLKGDLAFERFEKYIAPHLSLFDWIYLQGWGEPMLHGRLWDMISLAQAQDCRVGFTTNGTLLREKQIEKILDMGIDMLSISFAGASQATHEALRIGSDFEKLTGNISNLLTARRRRESEKPWVEMHYLMLQDNIGELPDFVRLGARLGADEVVATNLSYAPTLALDQKRTFGASHPDQAWQRQVDLAREASEQTGMQARIYPLSMETTLVCDAQPLSAVFVNHLGEVTPCVYLGLSRRGVINRYFDGEPAPFNRLSFGMVEDGLVKVLEGARRQTFIKPFKKRDRANTAASSFLAFLSGDPEVSLPQPPEPCRKCYKMYGI